MKFFKYSDSAMNYVDGKIRPDDVFISLEELIRDSGFSKGIKMMKMKMSKAENSNAVYLHFKNDHPATGIVVGWILEGITLNEY